MYGCSTNSIVYQTKRVSVTTYTGQSLHSCKCQATKVRPRRAADKSRVRPVRYAFGRSVNTSTYIPTYGRCTTYLNARANGVFYGHRVTYYSTDLNRVSPINGVILLTACRVAADFASYFATSEYAFSSHFFFAHS